MSGYNACSQTHYIVKYTFWTMCSCFLVTGIRFLRSFLSSNHLSFILRRVIKLVRVFLRYNAMSFF